MPNQFPTPADVLSAMKNSKVSLKVKELENGSIIQKGIKTILYSGGYSIVFPYKKNDGSKVAVRCWIADIGEAKKRTQMLSEHLSKLSTPYFVQFKYLDKAININGELNPLVIMDWVEGENLKDFLSENINKKDVVLLVAEHFKQMVQFFHENKMAHGDLQHGNILVKKTGELVAIDYDSMYIPELAGYPDNVKGLPGYQHPARQSNRLVSPKLDFFSEAVIYLSLIVFSEMPYLWDTYKETNDLLFSSEDFLNPDTSQLIKSLLDSGNRQIVFLTKKIKEYLKENSIDNLNCLEEFLVDKNRVIMDKILDKFEKQPNPPNYAPVFPTLNSILSKI